MRKFSFILIILGILLMLPWGIVSWMELGKVYRDIDNIPERDVGLLLGTTPGVGGNNLYFTTRIEAAKELYERGKIHHILVSGDNSDKSYNEPEAMRVALVKSGVPNESITLDYAGFRTLDSVIRARDVFSLTGGFTIISQPFHLERALFLGEMNDIEAIGYGAANISVQYGILPYIREIGARWLALYDGVFGTDPQVLGQKESIR